MNRTFVYPLQEPLETDILNINVDAMVAIGGVLQAMVGTDTTVFGLAATPVSPAGLGVTIGIGGVIVEKTVDSAAYSSLGTNSNPLMKMGMNYAPVTLPIVAPATAGYSQIYLIQVAFAETDTNNTVLPYLNPDDINQALPGPGGDNSPQPTRREQAAVLSTVAGTPAATGSQVAPAVSAGNVPLYYVTVANGQTAIISSNIIMAAGSPFLPNNLAGLRTPVYGTTLQLYVSPTGSDSNPGTSAQYPFQTINGALASAAQNYDFANASLQINLAAGNYAGCTVSGQSVPVPVTIRGNTASPSTVTITGSGVDCVHAVNGGNVTVSGLTMTLTGASASAVSCLHAQGGGTCAIGPSVVFGTTAAYHMAAQVSGFIGFAGGTSSYTVAGGGQAHWYTDSSGIVSIQYGSLTFTATQAFSSAFALCAGGNIEAASMTFYGSAIGQRYSVYNFGVISTNGAGASYLPGSTAGSVTNGLYN